MNENLIGYLRMHATGRMFAACHAQEMGSKCVRSAFMGSASLGVVTGVRPSNFSLMS